MDATSPVSAIIQHKGSTVWSVSPDISVLDAIRELSDHNVGALPVVEDGRLIGMISERDYTRKVILRGKASRNTPVREIMSSPPITVSPSHTVEQCMRIMTEHRTRHLPIIESGGLAGIVSIGDLVNWTLAAQAEQIRQLKDYISGGYPS
ncbi:MAG TPA: CBS domain-containing protein [Verrucomicrobiae bacterium]|nr:CBS domain-containing protein [Verrucomicrobiae bacterium]